MTCIVGLIDKKKKKVFIGADSAEDTPSKTLIYDNKLDEYQSRDLSLYS